MFSVSRFYTFQGWFKEKKSIHLKKKIYFPHTRLYFPFKFSKMCGKPIACVNALIYFEMAQGSNSEINDSNNNNNNKNTLKVVSKCAALLLPSCCSLHFWERFEIRPLQFLFTEALRSRSGDRGRESRANLQWQRGSDQPVHCLFPLAVPCSSPALTWDQSSQLVLTAITAGGCREGWSWISSQRLNLWKNTDIELFSPPASWVASLKSWLRDQWRRRSIWEVGQVTCHSDWVSTCPQWGLSGGNYVVTATPQFVSMLEERADMPPSHTPRVCDIDSHSGGL